MGPSSTQNISMPITINFYFMCQVLYDIGLFSFEFIRCCMCSLKCMHALRYCAVRIPEQLFNLVLKLKRKVLDLHCVKRIIIQNVKSAGSGLCYSTHKVRVETSNLKTVFSKINLRHSPYWSAGVLSWFIYLIGHKPASEGLVLILFANTIDMDTDNSCSEMYWNAQHAILALPGDVSTVIFPIAASGISFPRVFQFVGVLFGA